MPQRFSDRDWFGTMRDLVHVLIQACARTQCSINEHRPDLQRTWRTHQAEWQTFVGEDVRDREHRALAASDLSH